MERGGRGARGGLRARAVAAQGEGRAGRGSGARHRRCCWWRTLSTLPFGLEAGFALVAVLRTCPSNRCPPLSLPPRSA